MKVYRFVKQSTYPLWLKVGYENECRNLLNKGLMAPSYHDSFFGRVIQPPNEDRLNSFGVPKEMRKYFFCSLAEAIKYTKNQYERDANYGRYFEYILIEMEIPDEILKQYIGFGFYWYCEWFVEFAIPYEVLYELFAEKKDERFYIALEFYKKNLQNPALFHKNILNQDTPLAEEFKRIVGMIAKKERDDIVANNVLGIYPLLCFKHNIPTEIVRSGSDKYPDHEWLTEYDLLAWDILLDRDKKFRYYETIQKITGAVEGSLKYNHSFDRMALHDYAIPILQQENEELKKTLQKKKYHFTKI